jgi:hypothetical protein
MGPQCIAGQVRKVRLRYGVKGLVLAGCGLSKLKTLCRPLPTHHLSASMPDTKDADVPRRFTGSLHRRAAGSIRESLVRGLVPL